MMTSRDSRLVERGFDGEFYYTRCRLQLASRQSLRYQGADKERVVEGEACMAGNVLQ
jgi:hypothetical protein